MPNEKLKMVGEIEDVYKGKTKKNNSDYYRFTFKDETGRISAMFMDNRQKKALSQYKEKGNEIPKKGDIVVFTGRKGDDTLWLDNIGIQNDQVYMKLSDIK
tara:strand:- start:909 stop:1211 length:303 start_codon:yes stop_codon:yes gene_type:complete